MPLINIADFRAPTNQPSKISSTIPVSVANNPTVTRSPTLRPSQSPEGSAMKYPTKAPSKAPSVNSNTPMSKLPTSATPSKLPSSRPTMKPSTAPTTLKPSQSPEGSAMKYPTKAPSKAPSVDSNTPMSKLPTATPSKLPSSRPTMKPSTAPTTLKPSQSPEGSAMKYPTKAPSKAPSVNSNTPISKLPTATPSKLPSSRPTMKPSTAPTMFPTKLPSKAPSKTPTKAPSKMPIKSYIPSRTPTSSPLPLPTVTPVTYRQPTLSGSPTQKPIVYPTYAPASTLTEAGIRYHGGNIFVETNVVYLLWYGDWSGKIGTNSDSLSKQIITDFVKNVGGSPYWNILTSYTGQGGKRVLNNLVYGGAASFVSDQSISQDRINDVLTSTFDQGKLPFRPNNTMYVFLPSENILDDHNENCGRYCGFHSIVTYKDQIIPYALITNPYMCPTQRTCLYISSNSINLHPAADAMVSVTAHEIAEMITNPDLESGWYRDSDGEENADMCEWQFGTDTNYNIQLGARKYLIQKNWVNAGSGSCEMEFVSPYISSSPSELPTAEPSYEPTPKPSIRPTSPSKRPTQRPSYFPSTLNPTRPSRNPSYTPSRPSRLPTDYPARPTLQPTSTFPTQEPSPYSKISCLSAAPPSLFNNVTLNGVVGNSVARKSAGALVVTYTWFKPKSDKCSDCRVQLYLFLPDIPTGTCVDTTGSAEGIFLLKFDYNLFTKKCYLIYSTMEFGSKCVGNVFPQQGSIVASMWLGN